MANSALASNLELQRLNYLARVNAYKQQQAEREANQQLMLGQQQQQGLERGLGFLQKRRQMEEEHQLKGREAQGKIAGITGKPELLPPAENDMEEASGITGYASGLEAMASRNAGWEKVALRQLTKARGQDLQERGLDLREDELENIKKPREERLSKSSDVLNRFREKKMQELDQQMAKEAAGMDAADSAEFYRKMASDVEEMFGQQTPQANITRQVALIYQGAASEGKISLDPDDKNRADQLLKRLAGMFGGDSLGMGTGANEEAQNEASTLKEETQQRINRIKSERDTTQ